MAFLDWITKRANAKRESANPPERTNTNTALPDATKVQGRSTPDEIIAAERGSAAPEWSYQTSPTAKGNPVIWQAQQSLGSGCHVHIGKSAEGFHAALETPKDYHDPEWGRAHETAWEAKKEAYPKVLNPEAHEPSRKSAERGWDR